MAKFTFHNSGQFSYFTFRGIPRKSDGLYPTSSIQVNFISGSTFSDVTSSINSEIFGSPFVVDDFKWSVALPPGTSSFIWPSGSTETATTVPASASQMAATGEGTVTIGDTTFNLQDLTNFSFSPQITPGDSGGGGSTLATASNAFSMDFNEVDDFIVVNPRYQNLGISESISFSTWVKLPLNYNGGSNPRIATFMGEDWIFGFRGGSKRGAYFLIHNTDGTANSIHDGTTINDTNWHHVAATYDGTSNPNGLKIYIDGINTTSGQATSTGIRSFTGNGTTIGAWRVWSGIYPVQGNLDELAVFDYALDASTIESIYSASLPLGSNVTADLSTLSTPPVAWYRMGD